MSLYRSCGMVMIALMLCGCGREAPRGGTRLKTTPVRGIVEVDGKPALNVTVTCTPESSSTEIKHPIIASTDEKGAFAVSTYQEGDGLPEGEYALTFVWEEAMSLNPTKKDLLNRGYVDPKKSKNKITVIQGDAIDLGVIELSTKGPGK